MRVSDVLNCTDWCLQRVGSIVKEIKTAIEGHSRLDDNSWLQVGDKAGGKNGHTGDDDGEDGPSAPKKVKVSKERAVQGVAVLEKQLVEAFKKNNNMKGVSAANAMHCLRRCRFNRLRMIF